jgi:hypothetical protein
MPTHFSSRSPKRAVLFHPRPPPRRRRPTREGAWRRARRPTQPWAHGTAGRPPRSSESESERRRRGSRQRCRGGAGRGVVRQGAVPYPTPTPRPACDPRDPHSDATLACGASGRGAAKSTDTSEHGSRAACWRVSPSRVARAAEADARRSGKAHGWARKRTRHTAWRCGTIWELAVGYGGCPVRHTGGRCRTPPRPRRDTARRPRRRRAAGGALRRRIARRLRRSRPPTPHSAPPLPAWGGGSARRREGGGVGARREEVTAPYPLSQWEEVTAPCPTIPQDITLPAACLEPHRAHRVG